MFNNKDWSLKSRVSRLVEFDGFGDALLELRETRFGPTPASRTVVRDLSRAHLARASGCMSG